MKYAVHYRKDFRHFDTIDEVIFSVTKGNESIYTEIPKIIKNDWQKVILNLTEWQYTTENSFETIIPFILKLKEIHSNILVQLHYPFDDTEVQLMKDNNIPFMAAYSYCKSIDMVYTMKQYGVAEIYVAEGLAFDLPIVQRILEGTDIKIRLIPNVAQCAVGTKSKIPTIHKFWIRPEDTKFYETVANTFELYNQDDKLSTIYEIYKKQVWKGNLKDIILDAEDLDIENNSIPPYFGAERFNCKQRCFYNSCSICDACESFAKKFALTEQEIVYPKRKD